MITANCKNCKKDFLHTGSNRGLFCTFDCYNETRRSKSITSECIECSNIIKTTASKIKNGRSKFCSKACISKNHMRQPKECKYCKKEFTLKKKTYCRNAGIFCSQTCMYVSRKGVPHNRKTNNGMPAWNRGLIGYNSGETHPRWIKDRSKVKLDKERGGPLHKQWSKSVKNRDKWACRLAGRSCEGRMESHHILGWKEFPGLRYDINNGITLCHSHHPKTREEEKRLIPLFVELVSVSK